VGTNSRSQRLHQGAVPPRRRALRRSRWTFRPSADGENHGQPRVRSFCRRGPEALHDAGGRGSQGVGPDTRVSVDLATRAAKRKVGSGHIPGQTGYWVKSTGCTGFIDCTWNKSLIDRALWSFPAGLFCWSDCLRRFPERAEFIQVLWRRSRELLPPATCLLLPRQELDHAPTGVRAGSGPPGAGRGDQLPGPVRERSWLVHIR